MILGDASVLLFSKWVVIIDTQAGVKHVKGPLIKTGRILGCSRSKIIFWIVLPSAIPRNYYRYSSFCNKSCKRRNCWTKCNCTCWIWWFIQHLRILLFNGKILGINNFCIHYVIYNNWLSWNARNMNSILCKTR